MSSDYKMIYKLIISVISNRKFNKEKVAKLDNMCNINSLDVCQAIFDIIPKKLNKNLIDIISHLIRLKCAFRNYFFPNLQYFCYFAIVNPEKLSHSLQYYSLQNLYYWFKNYSNEFPQLNIVYNYFYNKSDLQLKKILDRESLTQNRQNKEANFFFFKVYTSRIHLINELLTMIPEIEDVLIELESLCAITTPTLENFNINIFTEHSDADNNFFHEEIVGLESNDEESRLHGLLKSEQVYQINIPANVQFASNDPIIMSTIQEREHLLNKYGLLIDAWQQILEALQKRDITLKEKYHVLNIPPKNETFNNMLHIISLKYSDMGNLVIKDFIKDLGKYRNILADYKYKPCPSFCTDLDFMWFDILNRFLIHFKNQILIYKKRCNILLGNSPKTFKPEASDDSNSNDFIEVEE